MSKETRDNISDDHRLRLKKVKDFLASKGLKQVEVYTAMGEHQSTFNSAMTGRSEAKLNEIINYLVERYPKEINIEYFYPEQKGWRENIEEKIEHLINLNTQLVGWNKKIENDVNLIASLTQKVIEAVSKMSHNQNSQLNLMMKNQELIKATIIKTMKEI